jgi:hypothetical protein
VVLGYPIGGHRRGFSQRQWALRYVSLNLMKICALDTTDECWAGADRFDDRLDQEALLDVLVKTEQDHARPTAAIQQQMKEAWGWP